MTSYNYNRLVRVKSMTSNDPKKRIKILKLYFLIIQITMEVLPRSAGPFTVWKHSIFGALHAGNYLLTNQILLYFR